MSRILILWTVVIVTGGLRPTHSWAQAVQPLSETQRQTFEQAASDLQTVADKHPRRQTPEWADAALFAKGLTWALRYDREFSPADISLLEKAIQRGQEPELIVTREERLTEEAVVGVLIVRAHADGKPTEEVALERDVRVDAGGEVLPCRRRERASRGEFAL